VGRASLVCGLMPSEPAGLPPPRALR